MTETKPIIPIEQWTESLQHAPSLSGGLFNRVIVLRQTDSTQDAARRMDARIGDVIVAWRQTSGRGRLGRVWSDTGEDGIATTFVVPRTPPERLAIASAVGVADAIDAAMKGADRWQSGNVKAGIKWPNDIVIDSRKIAGILIEQLEDRALVGVGVNVRQTVWPRDLRERATSLALLGFDIDRLTVLHLLLQPLSAALRDEDEALCTSFLRRDVLVGADAVFRAGNREIRGRVVCIHPMRGLAVLTADQGEVWLPAATTSVVKA